MLGYVGICWEMLGNVGKCWEMLHCDAPPGTGLSPPC